MSESLGNFTGRDVAAWRKGRNLSRKQLGERAGITEGKIWRIENKGVIHDDERAALAAVMAGGGPATAVPVPRPPTPPIEPTTAVVESSAPTTSPVVISEINVDLAHLSKIVELTYDRYVSNSELQTFKRCRRKWWLAWHRGLHLKRESPIGVRQIGDRLHRALKSHYVPAGPADPTQLLDALEREILIDRNLLDENTPEEVRKKFEGEADLQRIMLEGYLEWLAETGADSELEVVSAETYLEAHLMDYGPTSVAIIGKIDVRVRRKIDGAILFIDHKSVADVKSPTLMLALDEQMLHYHLLEMKNAGDGEHADGALYNMLRRVKRTARAQPPFYSRIEVRHNKHELEAYERRLRGEITDILDVQNALSEGASHQQVVYPRPSRDCTWDCPFLPICPMFDDGSRVEDLIKTYYDEGDPLEYYMSEVIGVNE